MEVPESLREIEWTPQGWKFKDEPGRLCIMRKDGNKRLYQFELDKHDLKSNLNEFSILLHHYNAALPDVKGFDFIGYERRKSAFKVEYRLIWLDRYYFNINN